MDVNFFQNYPLGENVTPVTFFGLTTLTNSSFLTSDKGTLIFFFFL